LASVVRTICPSLSRLAVHESSPCGRGASLFLKDHSGTYIATQFFPDQPCGATVDGWRNEDLERQTFADQSFDLVVTQDVMEHVFDPAAVCREVRRTLKPGGFYVFTAPTYKGLLQTERRAELNPDGSVRYLLEAEYHDSPVGTGRSLVTHHYGYDLPDLIKQWSGMDVEVRRFHDHGKGIIGEFTEVYVCRNAGLDEVRDSKIARASIGAVATSEAKIWEQSDYYDDAERWTWLFWSEAHPFRPLFDRLDLTRVVELACGHGRHAEHLLGHHAQRLGTLVMMDILQANVDYCKSRLGEHRNVEIRVNNGIDFQPLERNSVTSIFCYDSMVHFDRQVVRSYLHDAARILAPGGQALFHHSNCAIDPDSGFASNPHARAFMSAPLFARYARSFGLEVVQQTLFDWGGAPALDCISLLAKPKA
jgi:SAM-dependent methyltransferase